MVFAPALGVFAASVFLIGFCAAGFGLARHSFMTTRVPLAFRARALSLLGGTFRLGMFVGPFVAAGLLALFGDEHAAIWFFGGCLVATVLLVLLGPDPEKQLADAAAGGRAIRSPKTPASPSPARSRRPADRTSPAPASSARCGSYRRVLSRLGLAAASLSAVRSARQVVLPLWGVSIGLDAQTIALVVGISGAIDFALFYASGQVMDRFGRLWAALPAMVLMGAGFIALAFTHDLAERGDVVRDVRRGARRRQRPVERHPAHPRRRCRPARRPGAVPRLVAHAHRRGRRGLAAARLGHHGGVVAAIATGVIGVVGLLGALAFVRWVPRFVPRGASMMQFCRSRNDGRRCTRELGHRGLHRHRTIMWTDAGADDPHCPGSGSPGTAAPTLASGFPGGRRSARTAWASSRSTRSAGWSRTTREAPHPSAKQSSVRSGSTRTDGPVPRPTPRAGSHVSAPARADAVGCGRSAQRGAARRRRLERHAVGHEQRRRSADATCWRP